MLKLKRAKLNATDKKIIINRVCRLFQRARDVIEEDEELAQHYVATARRMAMASRVRIPREHRRQVCRGCKKFILPGVNCSVRIQPRREPHVVITCGYCGEHMRFPIKIREKRRT